MVRFRAWGLVLGVLLITSVVRGLGVAALVVAAVLGFYLLAVRPTRCRVEAPDGRPCPRPAYGLTGTCDRHADSKHGLPRLVSARAGALMFPLLIWPTADGTSSEAAAGPPPEPAEVATPAVDRAPWSRAMAWLVFASLVVATASFVRSLVGG